MLLPIIGPIQPAATTARIVFNLQENKTTPPLGISMYHERAKDATTAP